MPHSRLIIAVALGWLYGLNPALAAEQDWGLCHPWTKPELEFTADGDAEAATILSADTSESQNNEIVTLHGNVLVQRPGEQLFADEAVYNKLEETMDAHGNIRYDTPQFTTHSSSAHIELGTNQGRFTDNSFFLNERHARGESSEILLSSENLTVLKQSSYTTCDVGDNGWALKASTVELNHDSGMGDAYNARLYFHDVPFFYLPYIRFPISDARMTGVLMPSIGSSELGGNEFALPVYLNLHPQLDATITLHNFTNRGMQWQNEFRYLTSFGQGSLNADLLDDEVYGEKRASYAYRHQGELISNWRGDIEFQKVSDADYLNDFSASLNVTSATHLERHARFSNDQFGGSLSIMAQDYQTIDPEIPESSRPYRRLPQIAYITNTLQTGLFSTQLDSELVRFQHPELITSKRLNLMPSVSLPYQRPAGFLIPKFSAQYTRYEFDEEIAANTDTLTRTTPITSLDSGLYFERDTQLGGNPYLHTLEPRLFYVNVPYRDQSDFPLFDTGLRGFSSALLFQENRFTGVDRIGDTNQTSVSLTSRLINNHSGRELASITLGKIYYFDDRLVGLNGNIADDSSESDLIIEGRLQPTDNLSFKTDFLWDSEYDLITSRDFRMQYRSDNQHIFNVSYRDSGNRQLVADDDIVREVDTSIFWSVSRRWSIMAKRYFSVTDNHTLEKQGGIEYNSCCWAFRATRRAVFTEDTSATTAPFGHLRYSWYLQLELKGLTNVGDGIQELLEEQIPGYHATPY